MATTRPLLLFCALAIVAACLLGPSGVAGQTCQLHGSWKGTTAALTGSTATVTSEDTFTFYDDNDDAVTNDAYAYVYAALGGGAGEIGGYKLKSEVTIVGTDNASSCTVKITVRGAYSLDENDLLTIEPTECEVDDCPDSCAAYCINGCWDDGDGVASAPKTSALTFVASADGSDDECDSFTTEDGSVFDKTISEWWIYFLVIALPVAFCCCLACAVAFIIGCVVHRKKKAAIDSTGVNASSAPSSDPDTPDPYIKM